MSRASYVWKPAQLIIVKCEWNDGGVHRYDFKYIGNKLDAVISCLESVVPSKLDSFKITSIRSYKINKGA